jgi:hypothetical protein
MPNSAGGLYRRQAPGSHRHRYAESKIHQTDHRMNNFLMWLMVMAVALSILAISLFILNYISAYRSLTRTGVPRRNLIIWKRIAGFFLGGGRKSVLAPVEIYRVEHLKNTPVWLAWDIRWVAAGTELGKILDLIQSRNSLELVVQLFKPVRFTADEKSIDKVTFEPHSAIALIKRHTISSIYGVLKTSDESWQIPFRGVITCELVSLE